MYIGSVLDMKHPAPAPLAHWGTRVAALRTERDWSQAELARQAGVMQGTISRLESGAAVPNDLTRLAIARALDVSVYDLFAYDEAA
jgi:transcriptional regulator with XRE-family HTH domain